MAICSPTGIGLYCGCISNWLFLRPRVDSHCRYRIHITAELGESLQFAILCLIYLQCTCHLLHALDLGTTSHTGYGNTHIDSRTETLVEQIGFKEYLTVCNGNDIGWNIRGKPSPACVSIIGNAVSEPPAFNLAFQAGWKVIHLFGHFLLVDNLCRTLQQS